MGGWIIYSWECTLLSMKTCFETLPIYTGIFKSIYIYANTYTHTPMFPCGFSPTFCLATPPQSLLPAAVSQLGLGYTPPCRLHMSGTQSSHKCNFSHTQLFTDSSFHKLHFSQTPLSHTHHPCRSR
jgi:hypothetical protein